MSAAGSPFAAVRGDAHTLEVLDAWRLGALEAEVLGGDHRRTRFRLPASPDESTAGRSLLVKEQRVPSHRDAPWRWERLRRHCGLGPARREYRQSRALASAGAPVAPALAWAIDRAGSEWLVRPFEAGAALRERLADERDPQLRRRLMTSLGRAVAALHERGWVHADLHLDNVLAPDGSDDDLLLLDTGRARRTRSARARRRDLLRLDHSLARSGASLTDRLRTRRAALAWQSPERARAELRALGRAADEFARSHARRRSRRARIARRRYARAECGGWRGMRCAGFEPGALRAAVEAHQNLISAAHSQSPDDAAPLLKFDHRARISRVECEGLRVVVKAVVKGGALRRLADTFRGSPARRAWLAGHGLLERGFAAARPLAYLERKRLGIPIESLVVLEDLSPAPSVATTPPGHPMADPEAALQKLTLWLIRLHRCKIHHGDLQATHIHWNEDQEPTLIDLESLRFKRHLSERSRIQALTQLNSSIPESQIPNHQRSAAFAHYTRRHPFESGNEQARQTILRNSEHRNRSHAEHEAPLSR